MGVVRVACVQMRSGINESQNFSDMEQMVREAASQGAFYIQTPEMSGILQKDGAALLNTISGMVDNHFVKLCSLLSRELGIWLHIGSTATKLDGGKVANRAFLFAPNGKQICFYDKIHMFDVDLGKGNRWKESSRYQAGNRSLVVDVAGFKLGLSICYDVRFPQIYRQQAKLGASVLTCPAAFTKPTGEAHWKTLLQARAIENGAFMIAAAQGGTHEDGRETYGHSMIVNPWGDVIGEIEHNEPGILVANIDIQEVADARAKIPNLVNEKKFSISYIDASDANGTK